MLWSKSNQYSDEPFELEADLETAIQEVKGALFGNERIYLETKKKIGKKGKTQNIPDAYLIDLTSKKEPKLYVVENELAKHDPLKHIAIQILSFSLSYETTPQTVKRILKDAISADTSAFSMCAQYAQENGYENVDYLLERIIYRDDSFNALVIIDEIPDELETVLISKFKFPVEILTLGRYKTDQGARLYKFEPFLSDVSSVSFEGPKETQLDPAEIDTIVVPAREDGFKDVFIGENCWYQIRIHSSMLNKVKNIAAYQVAPVSAITHIAKVKSIEQYKDTNKYKLIFEEPAKTIGPIKLVAKGRVKAPQASRYTSLDLLINAKTMDDAF
ncbi:hypothetical protein P9J64_02955 [Deltaproteobacteria bacterium IMCC39524]|nr:hypothetical protein [Deltaproteobacteria bacterium IMCC39524]